MAQDGQAKQQGGQGPRNRRLWLAGGGLTVLILGLIILISPLSPFNIPTPTPGPGETPVATPRAVSPNARTQAARRMANRPLLNRTAKQSIVNRACPAMPY